MLRNMDKIYIPCLDCFDSLMYINNTVGSLWVDLCLYCDEVNTFVTCESDPREKHMLDMDLYILEEMGFIITHETELPHKYLVKLLGFSRDTICAHNH